MLASKFSNLEGILSGSLLFFDLRDTLEAFDDFKRKQKYA